MGKQKSKKQEEPVMKKKMQVVTKKEDKRSFKSMFDKTNFLKEQIKAREMIKNL